MAQRDIMNIDTSLGAGKTLANNLRLLYTFIFYISLIQIKIKYIL